MPVWPFLIIAAMLLMLASVWVKRDWEALTMAVLSIALAAMQLKKLIFGGDDLAFVVSAVIWVIASGAIPRQLGSNLTQNMLKVFAIRACYASSGLCYFWARIIDAPRVFGSAPYLTADLLLIAAMLLIGGFISGDVIGRVKHLGRSLSGRRDISSAASVGLAQEATVKPKIGGGYAR